jgi:hypothetical protein
VRDLCVAVAAVIPLLVLTVVVQGTQGMHAMMANVVQRAGEQQRDPQTAGENLVLRGSWLFKRLLTVCATSELAALAVIPFVPDGPPNMWWHWIVLIMVLVVVVALFVFIRLLLDSFLRAEGEAAARERGHGPSPGRHW